MNGWHLSVGLLIVLGYIFHRMDSRLAWERKHHEEAVARWRQERQASGALPPLMWNVPTPKDVRWDNR